MEWLYNGLTMMVCGMGTVFLFLTLLVFLMNVSAWFFKKYAHLFPEEAIEEAVVEKKKSDDTDIAVAIAAIQAFRSK